MDNRLRNSLERLKSLKVILPEVCLQPGKPVELNKWLKRTAINSAVNVTPDTDLMNRLYSKVKNGQKGNR